ncbi:MAG: acyltransferase, partial [Muribaculaceae bacterium]|nr:acyltransferase [Muribaculaceae bacterium]
ALSEGEILSMPADRVFGSQKSFSLDFMGAKAKFPQGPFLLAAMRDVPMLFVSVMKTAATKYHISVRKIQSREQGSASRIKAADLAHQYVALLEETVKRHPAQWYNYFEFWAD